MGKMLEATVSYSIPDNFDNAGQEISGSFEYLVIDTIDDAIESLGENDCKKLLQKAIKIQSANKARIKLMSENKHLAYKELSEESKAKLKLTRKRHQDAIKVLQSLDSSQLEELGITL